MAAATLTPPAGDATAKAKPTTPRLETYAKVGDTVEWFPASDPTDSPFVGVVTQKLLNFQVTVNAMSPDWPNVLPLSPCYHMSDANGRKDGNQEGGGWRHKPETIAVRRMLIDQGYLVWQGNELVPCDPAAKS